MRVESLGLRVEGLGFRIREQGMGFIFWDFRLQVQGLGVQGFRGLGI